eukprot:GHVN01029201.1.p1 GENE.GHVN01029201.1~~GHVN01029201.1.p1  ORF type:complete len:281 (-),score=77.56 GHVN01029201.1:541-1383(-)
MFTYPTHFSHPNHLSQHKHLTHLTLSLTSAGSSTSDDASTQLLTSTDSSDSSTDLSTSTTHTDESTTAVITTTEPYAGDPDSDIFINLVHNKPRCGVDEGNITDSLQGVEIAYGATYRSVDLTLFDDEGELKMSWQYDSLNYTGIEMNFDGVSFPAPVFGYGNALKLSVEGVTKVLVGWGSTPSHIGGEKIRMLSGYVLGQGEAFEMRNKDITNEGWTQDDFEFVHDNLEDVCYWLGPNSLQIFSSNPDPSVTTQQPSHADSLTTSLISLISLTSLVSLT